MADTGSSAKPLKPLWKSKTFWFNILAVAASGVGSLPPDIAVIAIPVVNLLLRVVTNQPVSLK